MVAYLLNDLTLKIYEVSSRSVVYTRTGNEHSERVNESFSISRYFQEGSKLLGSWHTYISSFFLYLSANHKASQPAGLPASPVIRHILEVYCWSFFLLLPSFEPISINHSMSCSIFRFTSFVKINWNPVAMAGYYRILASMTISKICCNGRLHRTNKEI